MAVYRVAPASAARMASAPAGWPFSFEYGPYGIPHTGVLVACRRPSASGPASTTPYPMESMNAVTAAFAGPESPAIGRYERSGAPAGRPSVDRQPRNGAADGAAADESHSCHILSVPSGHLPDSFATSSGTMYESEWPVRQ
jgi:hypothetical protein